MRIGIDIQTTLGKKTGFGFYVTNLIKELRRNDKKNQYFFFKPKTEQELFSLKRFVWDQFQLPNQAREKKVDILHQTCFSAPIFYSGKVVVTVHDLIARLYGKDIHFGSRQFFGKWMPFSYRKANKIIANSEHTKKDIIKYLRIPKEKIIVIPLAAGEEFKVCKNQEEITKIKEKYKTGGNYILNIGTLNPRKNLEFLIRVFAKVVDEIKDYNLVVTGKEGWYYEGLFTLAKKLGLSKKIIFTGYVDDKDKPLLINGARLFVFPSLYEGFGLPPLEAMSCGIPVISSNTSSLPEVIGDGGILLSPNDELGWVMEIKKLLTDEKYHQFYQSKGLDQAKKFSWKRCAQETIKVYEEVYKSK